MTHADHDDVVVRAFAGHGSPDGNLVLFDTEPANLPGSPLIQITHKRTMLGKAFLESLKEDPTLMHEVRQQIRREVGESDQLRILEFKTTHQWVIDRARSGSSA